MTYSEKLRDPRWQRKRLEILLRDKFACRLCGDAETTLHVHHLRYRRGADPWNYQDQSLATVCEGCHAAMHRGKFGERLVEMMVAGGADTSDMENIASALEFEFGGHPFPLIALTPDQWTVFSETLAWLFIAVRDDATVDEISTVLAELRPPNQAKAVA